MVLYMFTIASEVGEWGQGFLIGVLTFIKLGILREPCCSEPGTGLFGFDLCRGDKVEQ